MNIAVVPKVNPAGMSRSPTQVSQQTAASHMLT